MGSGPLHVDYGPMALPVGEKAAADGLAMTATLQSDAFRLRSILSLDAGLARSLHDDATRSASTPEEDAHGWSESADERRLGEEIERLWVNDGACGTRGVRLKLSETVIPGTWVRIAMHAGALLIELSCTNEGTCHWLCKAASRLAVDVSARLHQSVHVVVLDGDAHQAGAGHAHCGNGGRP